MMFRDVLILICFLCCLVLCLLAVRVGGDATGVDPSGCGCKKSSSHSSGNNSRSITCFWVAVEVDVDEDGDVDVGVGRINDSVSHNNPTLVQNCCVCCKMCLLLCVYVRCSLCW